MRELAGNRKAILRPEGAVVVRYFLGKNKRRRSNRLGKGSGTPATGFEAISCALERARGKNLRKKEDADHRPRLAGKSFRATDFVLEIEDGYCGVAVDLLRSARQQKVSLCSKIELAPLGYA